jgi:uncharacterized membrane protein
VLALTMGVAAALRFAGLQSGLWYDEISSLVRSVRLPLSQILTESRGVTAHPLYSVLAHASITGFGESAWSLRLPACLFGIAAVWMVFVLGTKLTSRVEAWAAMAVLATSYHHIWFSQNARGYTMLAFLTSLSTWLLIRARESGRSRDYTFYALACAAAVYTHLTMVFMVLGQAVALTADWMAKRGTPGQRPLKPALWAWTVVGLLAAVAYAPVIPALVTHFAVDAPLPAASIATPSWALAETVRSLLSGAGVPAALAGGVLLNVGAVSLARRDPLSVALLVVPGIVTAAGLLLLGQAIRPRFFFFLSGAAAIFVGRGIGALAAAIARRQSATSETSVAAVVIGTLLFIAAAAVELPRNYLVPKQDFEGAVHFLEREESGGAKIGAAGLVCLPVEKYFEKTWPCVTSTGDFDRFGASGPSVRLVFTLADYIDDVPLRRQLLDSCGVVRIFPGTLGGGEVVVCEPKPKGVR